MNIKKILISGVVITVFTFYSLRSHFGDDGEGSYALPTPVDSSNLPPSSSPTFVSTPVPTVKPVGKYKDGIYTGIVADAFYGNIQVQAVVNGGKLTDVVFLQYPNDRNTSIEINTQAMPILKREAIMAQSAQVDGASGATASSQAFIQSLGDALRQATL